MIKPTYLYIKEHTVTGLRYFGKTTKYDVNGYLGSGKYWLRHINKYGKEHVVTKWISEPFTDESRLVEFATLISEEMNIVKSDKWANLIEENGIDGWVKGISRSEETKKKLSDTRKNNPLTEAQKEQLIKLRKVSGAKKGHVPWNKGKSGYKHKLGE
jgi:hypothetical protein